MRREFCQSRFVRKPIFHRIEPRIGESGAEIADHNRAERSLSDYQTMNWPDLGGFFRLGDWKKLEERLKSSSEDNDKLLERVLRIFNSGVQVINTNNKLESSRQDEHRDVEHMIMQLAAAAGIDLSIYSPELVELAEKIVSLSVKKE